mmetsp:Transcript_33797/g.32862  ORF Transcript_33797/g.32862 Transcript_33797/m.32862 type:complete len:243 (-) Transcript_33797:78-806(-)
MVDYSKGLNPVADGIIGFGRGASFIEYPVGPIFYYYLYDEEMIDNLVFATYYSVEADGSFVQIGAYDDDGSSGAYTGELVWIDALESETYYWITTSAGVDIYEKFYEADEETYVVLDTANPGLILPEKYGKKIQKKLATGNRGFKWGKTWYMRCDNENMESFFLEMGGYLFEIPPSVYLYDWRESQDKTYCDLNVYTYEEGHDFLVGQVIFKSYYTVWDEDNSRVGFAASSGASVSQPTPSS